MKNSHQYGIVIDSGLSGLRIQIYRWDDISDVADRKDSQLKSPPKIIQEKGWTLKISPGISTFDSPSKYPKIWSDHYLKLIEFAETIIPADLHATTPVYVLATAGMRLLPKDKQKKILKQTCKSLQKQSNFFIPNCGDFVQIIDGETEGLYGWLGLNYLMGQFNNYEEGNTHESIGFMDMGGASTQIAFVPSDPADIESHAEDLSTVTLRNINGVSQKWNVFVETWLGFGANEARKRYLNQLIYLFNSNPAVSDITDPCSPRGVEITHSISGTDYTIKGLGNYEMCLKEIYPLLMKNIPCKEQPCLFNGIHGPKLNFDKDKFVGISEYWYTANDVFQSGGEYNYHGFSEKVKQFCESDWDTIVKNARTGQYLDLDPEKFLKSACFKASWVINVLHEGFDLPRLGVDVPDKTDKEQQKEMEKTEKVHVPFKLADSVDGEELSWTLGKILLYASSQVSSKDSTVIGIQPAPILNKPFVPGGVGDSQDYDLDSDDEREGSFSITTVLLVVVLVALVYQTGRYIRHGRFRKFTPTLRRKTAAFASRIPYINRYFESVVPYTQFEEQDQVNSRLEEGIMLSTTGDFLSDYSLRTRSNLNLNEINDDSRTFNFLNKPFIVPKRNGNSFYGPDSLNTSRESLHRVGSSNSINRARSVE